MWFDGDISLDYDASVVESRVILHSSDSDITIGYLFSPPSPRYPFAEMTYQVHPRITYLAPTGLPKDLLNIVNDYHCHGMTLAIIAIQPNQRCVVYLYFLYGQQNYNYEEWHFDTYHLDELLVMVRNNAINEFVTNYAHPCPNHLICQKMTGIDEPIHHLMSFWDGDHEDNPLQSDEYLVVSFNHRSEDSFKWRLCKDDACQLGILTSLSQFCQDAEQNGINYTTQQFEQIFKVE